MNTLIFKLFTFIVLLFNISFSTVALAKNTEQRKFSMKDLTPEQRQTLNQMGKVSGTYTFKSSSGMTYDGKSNNIQQRTKQHLYSGKLSPNDLSTVKITGQYPKTEGNKTKGTIVGVAEPTKIKVKSIINNGQIENKTHNKFGRLGGGKKGGKK